LLPVTLGAAVVLLMAAAVAAYVVMQDHPLDRPCPAGSRSIHPTEVHLVPTLLEHHNWVAIPPSEIAAGQVLAICTDGRAIGEAVMDPEDAAANRVELNVPTRWADLTWASGRLSDYFDPDRWLVVFPPLSRDASGG
jgi:hypothetical protein